MNRTKPQHQFRHSTPLGAMRARAKLSQERAAELAGITRIFWMRIEKGQSWPKPATLAAIAKALDRSESAVSRALVCTRNRLGLPVHGRRRPRERRAA